MLKAVCYFTEGFPNWHRGLWWSWSYSSWVYNYLCNQCLSQLQLWVRTPFMVRYTRCNIMWQSYSVICDRSVVFSGYSGLNARHFGTGTNRHQDTLASVWDISAPRQFGTRTIRHLCETFRHQDSSAPGQFGTCVFLFDFTYKTSNSLESIPNLIVILMFCNRFFCILSFNNYA